MTETWDVVPRVVGHRGVVYVPGDRVIATYRGTEYHGVIKTALQRTLIGTTVSWYVDVETATRVIRVSVRNLSPRK